MIELLVAAVLAVSAIILILLLQISGKLGKTTIDPEAVKGAVATSWKELGVDQDIGAIKEKATDIQAAAQDLQTLFKVTRGRGEYGEFQLEQILNDLLPKQYVHIREKIAQTGKIPDAHIITPNGIVCIDSKFPLDNYREMLKATDDVQKQSYGISFCKDVEGHIAKIKNDYVKPEEGTTPFAFGFIPSEAVYQFLTECHPNIIADAAKEGVLVVSPATLAINLNLLTVGLRATEIAENAQQIQNNIIKLSKSLNEVEEAWNTLYSHIQKAYNKASEVNDKHSRLRTNFERITERKEET
ncbi:DNA recombination protein RmuC [Candidatus Bathyarchaeota archaeon A05DMB-2]|jgi:DNA recombination protein RmuC|nr:DNA recombination protein RmuC [Candidatus Bathyarchaeota archaeon A05DMB-2]